MMLNAARAARMRLVGFLSLGDRTIDPRIFAREMEATTRAVRLLLPPGPVCALLMIVFFWRDTNHVLMLGGLALLVVTCLAIWRLIETKVVPENAARVALKHIVSAGLLGLSWSCITIGLAGTHNTETALVLLAYRMALITISMIMYFNLPLGFLAFAIPIAIVLVAGIEERQVFHFACITIPVFLVICMRTTGDQLRSFRSAAMTMERLHDVETNRAETERRTEVLRAQDAERAVTAMREADARRHGEMLALADQFETNVVGIVDSVLRAVRNLEGSAATLSTVTQSAAHATEDVAGQAAVTSRSVTRLAEATDEMAHAISDIAARVDDHARLSDRARGVAEASAARVNHLADDAGRIGGIVTLITGVTSRTRLLALNAAIEAARAGEAGRGFAVVANEVKSLAQRADEATQSVTVEIGGIVNRIGSAMSDIRETAAGIDGVAKIAGSIAGTVVGQRAATERIERETQVVVELISDMHRRIAALSEGAGTAGRMTSEVASTANHLTAQARSLDSETNAFLLRLRAS